VVDKVGRLAHRRVQPQTFERVLSIFVTAGNLDADDDFVRVNLSYDALFLRPIEEDPIASF
jgi:hypothetical protein